MDLAEALEECMWTAIAAPPGPLVSGPSGDQVYRQGARALWLNTDKAIIGLFGGNLLEIGEFLFRMDNFLGMLAGEPKKVHRFLDRLVEHHLANLEKFLRNFGEYIDIILFGDDLGMQTGPLISPAMYREFFKPRHKLLWTRAKELAEAWTRWSSNGNLVRTWCSGAAAATPSRCTTSSPSFRRRT